jgi:NAD(P)-dependent dehydrogenase (short-subunit alcohol dehydrogenase family)
MSSALITGGSQGLGLALAESLVREGWSVVIDARRAETLAQAAQRLRAIAGADTSVIAVAGDVTDPAHRARLVGAVEAIGGLDVIVNNASTLGATPLPSLSVYPLDELRRVFEVDVVAPLALVQDLWPSLSAASAPRVVNITSDAAVEAYPGWGGYGMAKAALDQLSAVLAAECPFLRVWAVDPGDLRTQMHQDAFPGEDISDRPEPATVVGALVALIGSDHPSGRLRLAELACAGQRR